MNSQYSYIIIDDDTFARETLIDLLSDVPELFLLKSLSESGMAIKHLATLQPDIVFLDINMPDKSGIDIQQEIIDLKLTSKVIFTTAHEEFVLEAFKNKAFDYLVKPVSKKELNETLLRFFNQQAEAKMDLEPGKTEERQAIQNEIVVKNAYGTLILNREDVLYIEAEGAYSGIYLTSGNKELVSKNIGKIESLFSADCFFKISRSCIINLKYLKKTDRLNKKVTLTCQDKEIKLKATRDHFYDLEKCITNRL